MKPQLRRGLLRSALAICLLSAVYAIFAATGGTLAGFLRWFDFLSPVPGLSGLVILALAPVLVLAFFFAVQWVWTGFSAQSED